MAIMVILHIEHPISDYDAWHGAFDRFAPMRTAAGVVGHRVLRPVDDDHYVVVQLDLADEETASTFLGLLRDRVWSNPEASPALRGEPRARILHVTEEGAAPSA